MPATNGEMPPARKLAETQISERLWPQRRLRRLFASLGLIAGIGAAVYVVQGNNNTERTVLAGVTFGTLAGGIGGEAANELFVRRRAKRACEGIVAEYASAHELETLHPVNPYERQILDSDTFEVTRQEDEAAMPWSPGFSTRNMHRGIDDSAVQRIAEPAYTTLASGLFTGIVVSAQFKPELLIGGALMTAWTVLMELNATRADGSLQDAYHRQLDNIDGGMTMSPPSP